MNQKYSGATSLAVDLDDPLLIGKWITVLGFEGLANVQDVNQEQGLIQVLQPGAAKPKWVSYKHCSYAE